jgi:colanic acid/amylovoran biosynthesis glycosyltransferase
MLTIAYLANQFPAVVEPYVGEEIEELRRRGVTVIPGTVRKPDGEQGSAEAIRKREFLCLQPVRVLTLLRALALIARRWRCISDLAPRVLLRGEESPMRRIKALLHTWLGACYAFRLQRRGVNHIHAHHGYFGAWIAMVAARLLGVSYSLTLHGSDLLVNGAYLDTKLKNCRFCVTISEFNRRHILERFPTLDPKKIVVSRLGADVPDCPEFRSGGTRRRTLNVLAVGRLHVVKDHAFLIRACVRLRDHGLDFQCAIAGEGPERHRLESLIREHRLQGHFSLRGQLPPEQIDALYRRADVVVLTSRSEGIPLVLMEAMVRGKIVLAPAITGIPELVIPGKTGFLYRPGALEDFVEKLFFIQELIHAEDCPARLDWIRHAARVQVVHNFNRKKNLTLFADRFLQLVVAPNFEHKDAPTPDWSLPHEDLVLQQI